MKSISIELFARLVVPLSNITMKKRVPPNAQRTPKTAAMCITSFLFSGILFAITPDIIIGIPITEGIYVVGEFKTDI